MSTRAAPTDHPPIRGSHRPAGVRPRAAPRLLLACAPRAGPAARLVADGFTQPVGIVAAGDGSGRLFVVEQRGTVALAPTAR
jgi:hypothetical protein